MWEDSVYDWTKDYSMNMIIYGASKIGKTYLAAGKAKAILQENPEAKVYVINTDKGWAKPALQQGLAEYKDRIVYEYVNTIKHAIRVMNRFKEVVKPHDLIIFDLYSWVWTEAQQEFVNELSRGEIVGFIAKAMKTDSSFGDFTGIQWQFIKRLDDHISNPLSKNPICNVIAICRCKDPTTGNKISGKEEDIWCQLGIPEARKDIAYEFANIIKIEKLKGRRRFLVVGSRDFDPDWTWHEYTDAGDFWSKMDNIYNGLEITKPQDSSGPKRYTSLSATDKKEIRAIVASAFKDSDSFTIEDVMELGIDVEDSAIKQILADGVDAGKLLLDGVKYSFPKAVEEEPKAIEEEPNVEEEPMVIEEEPKVEEEPKIEPDGGFTRW